MMQPWHCTRCGYENVTRPGIAVLFHPCQVTLTPTRRPSTYTPAGVMWDNLRTLTVDLDEEG